MNDPTARLAVLTSGGLDSAMLLADLAGRCPEVYPIYVRSGHYWEPAEFAHLAKFVELVAQPAIRPLVVLDMPVTDLYGKHWSITGQHVPNADSPDEAVHLPGRNLLLATKAMLWCRLRDVPGLALAILKSNPFVDASDGFFKSLEALFQAAGQDVAVLRPYARLTKTDVLRKGRELPLQWTFSCICPIGNRHCGECNKCAERQKAFAEAELPDPTEYASRHPTPTRK